MAAGGPDHATPRTKREFGLFANSRATLLAAMGTFNIVFTGLVSDLIFYKSVNVP